MRATGKTALPAAVHLDSAEDFVIPSRGNSRSIPCRILKPQGNRPVKAVFMHIHGGGWVLQDEKSQDPFLQWMADQTGCLCISVGYRLAPEHPFPAGPEDCFDAAEWLIDNAVKEFGAPLAFLGGESAGGHLSALTALHLLNSSKEKYSQFSLNGLLLHYGTFSSQYDLESYTTANIE